MKAQPYCVQIQTLEGVYKDFSRVRIPECGGRHGQRVIEPGVSQTTQVELLSQALREGDVNRQIRILWAPKVVRRNEDGREAVVLDVGGDASDQNVAHIASELRLASGPRERPWNVVHPAQVDFGRRPQLLGVRIQDGVHAGIYRGLPKILVTHSEARFEHEARGGSSLH
ncbi:MAG: hypothetical protein H0W81_01970 [Chloroflexi bacterium]|nr:hypothetical protein [Chloroflexota bacterium]